MLDLDQIATLYHGMAERHQVARELLGRPLTLAEKILFGHLLNLEEKPNGYTSWIGHSSFIINNFDLNIITDPIFSLRTNSLIICALNSARRP